MLRLFDSPQNETTSQAKLAVRVLGLLAHSLELNLLAGRGLNADVLKADLARLTALIEAASLPEDVLQQTTQTCSDLQHYFRHLSASMESLASELSVGIRSLEEILAELSGDHTRNIARLEALSHRFSEQRGLDDIHALRKHLEECVHQLREEVKEHRLAQARWAESLGQGFGALRQSAAQLPVTRPALAFAVLRLRSLERITQRFGAPLALAMREYLEGILAQRLPEMEISVLREDSLLLLNSQDLDVERLRDILRRLARERLAYSANINGTEQILPLHIDWLAALAESQSQAEQLARNFLLSSPTSTPQ